MGSANFQHHHLQDQQHHLLDSSSPPNSSYGVSWPQQHPTSLSSRNNFIPSNNNIDGAIINSRQDSNTPNMAQDMGFQWTHCTNTTAGVTFTGSGRNQSPHDFQLERIKDEFSAETYPKFTEMISSSPTSSIEDLHLHPSSSHIKNQQQQQREFNGLSQLPSGGDFMFYSNNNNNNNSHRGTFSQIFPTVNISNLNHHSSSSSSLDMNLPALDLFSGSLIQPSSVDHTPQFGGIFKDTTTFSSYGSVLDHMQQVGQRPRNKISAAFNSGGGGGTEAKRPACNFMDTTKASPQAAPPKKSRLESRASCPPFKVRKEKLGDRIAALQQLVAPFGKTDTASVLMEAIGYIKFLQNQVETLSVPYMKSNKTSRTMRGGSMEDANDQEQKQDLRSRGLCLVPLPCLSYVTDGGGGVWPPPNFTSAT